MGAQESQQDKTYKYHRRSTRLPKHDYTWSRGYFVTIRTSTHDPLFEVPQLHAILRETWEALPQRFPGVTLDAFVIMPDHVHFILWLDDCKSRLSSRQNSGLKSDIRLTPFRYLERLKDQV